LEELKKISMEKNCEVIRIKNKSADKHCLLNKHTTKIVDIVMCLHFKTQTKPSRNSEELQEIVTCTNYFHRKIERKKLRIGKKNSFMNKTKKKKLGIKKDVCTYYIPNFHRKASRAGRANGKNKIWEESNCNCIAVKQAAHSFVFNFFCKTAILNKYDFLYIKKKFKIKLKKKILYFKKIKIKSNRDWMSDTTEILEHVITCSDTNMDIEKNVKKRDLEEAEILDENDVVLVKEINNTENVTASDNLVEANCGKQSFDSQNYKTWTEEAKKWDGIDECYLGNEEMLGSLALDPFPNNLLKDCASKEDAYSKLVIEQYSSNNFWEDPASFMYAAIALLYPKLNIKSAVEVTIGWRLIAKRIIGLDNSASHPLLPNINFLSETLQDNHYFVHRLQYINADMNPLTSAQWMKQPHMCVTN